MTTPIEWTDETWNPVRARLRSDPGRVGWHCEHKSPGCENCYSETRNLSGRCNLGTKLPFKPGRRKDVEIFLDERALTKPLHWRKPRMIFVCSMTDLFADFVTDEMIDRVFAVMALCPQHTFQVLTKRSARMREYMAAPERKRIIAAEVLTISDMLARKARSHKARIELDHFSACFKGSGPFPNVWLGVSVEDQARADERIPDLLATPAAVRWLSCEPLLGPVDLNRLHYEGMTNIDALRGQHGVTLPLKGECAKLNWIVCGGESGKGARPMHPAWARSLRDQCAAAGVPFFFKQWGAWLPAGQIQAVLNKPWSGGGEGRALLTTKANAGRWLDGVKHDGFPATRSASEDPHMNERTA